MNKVIEKRKIEAMKITEGIAEIENDHTKLVRQFANIEEYTKLLEEDGEESKGASFEELSKALGNSNSSSNLSDCLKTEVAGYSEKDLNYRVTLLRQNLENAKPNMSAIEEYRDKTKNYMERLGVYEKITEERDRSREECDTLRKKRLDEFMNGFGTINMKLKEMYQMITLGGDAELELVDSLDPFSEGIIFSVRPPNKSWKNISNLSGGEKTLSSLSLVFALHHYKPTPIYVMDEIDAALDFRNVSIIANYVKERAKNAQFVIISLRNNMFELSDRLLGVYKVDDCSRNISIMPGKFL